ncbi:hypothetical protein SRABI27_02793 [Pedobacter sp. Bi27]|uniref:hypothetical protein n=1 Tax=unclassified Pedobacter TaxID=2628915 RepID=UPI001DE8D957|nr:MULTISPECIES: hypothetical protein [unclassified Pedobacter]CAH0243961.1 hypothetical protein SRABI27_02793 [Pedobacter sp. Bi27]CAH0281143.1 hypothetical protein SRABI126_03772 [Pedobacter sp. Bi126]CAH0307754.1 hypothetical protein SRABI36_04888 [Pedobacter sp. Bi36]
MGFFEDFTDDYIKPFGELIVLVTFSIYTRIALCVYLVFSDPLSVEFKYLVVIIFCIPILRYIFHSVTKTDMPDGSNMFTSCVFPVLYPFANSHILYLYNFPTLLALLILFIPMAIYYAFFIAERLYPDNRIKFLTTLCFYVLQFLFAVNFAFDTAKTIDKRYYVISKNEIVTGGNGPEDFETHHYYLDLVPINKNVDPPKWIEVSEKTDSTFRGVFSTKFLLWNGKPYRIFAKKKVTDTIKRKYNTFLLPRTRLRYYFLLQHDLDYERKKIKGEVYDKFNIGSYIIIEKHPGLLGIEWITYR